jgi:hypothetical protein
VSSSSSSSESELLATLGEGMLVASKEAELKIEKLVDELLLGGAGVAPTASALRGDWSVLLEGSMNRVGIGGGCRWV